MRWLRTPDRSGRRSWMNCTGNLWNRWDWRHLGLHWYKSVYVKASGDDIARLLDNAVYGLETVHSYVQPLKDFGQFFGLSLRLLILLLFLRPLYALASWLAGLRASRNGCAASSRSTLQTDLVASQSSASSTIKSRHHHRIVARPPWFIMTVRRNALHSRSQCN